MKEQLVCGGAACSEWGPPGFRAARTSLSFLLTNGGRCPHLFPSDLRWLSLWCRFLEVRGRVYWVSQLPKRPRERMASGWSNLSVAASSSTPSTHKKREKILAHQAVGEESSRKRQGQPFSRVKPGKATAFSSRHPQLVLVCPHGLWWERWAYVPSEGGNRQPGGGLMLPPPHEWL